MDRLYLRARICCFTVVTPCWPGPTTSLRAARRGGGEGGARGRGCACPSTPSAHHPTSAPPQRWDTIKPLGAWFARLDRVALVDDDAFKAAPGERGNLVHVPCWDEGDASCGVLHALAAALQEALGGVGVGGDVRGAVGGVEAALAPFWARARKKLAGAGGEGGEGGGTQPAAGGRGSANAEPALAA